ncbi:MAG: hypothetical protein H6540_03860 [Bacteroidales bacterium]|nr:hypothetical protein [Bacteroidales bacterium]
MKLDNKKQTYQIWLRKLVLTTLLIISLITVGYTDFFKTPVLGLEKSWYLGFLAVIYIGLSLIGYILKPCFVSYNDSGEKIILRFYPMRILNSKKNSIEIAKHSFTGYKIKTFFFGTKEMLFLKGRINSNIATYPGVSLSAVNRSDREKIKAALDGILITRK